jgi:hypothetical protein
VIGLLLSKSRGTNFYRIHQPIHLLTQYKIVTRATKEINPDCEDYAKELSGITLLICSMPHTMSHLFVIMAAQAMGIPVISDVDDLILEEQYPEIYQTHRDCLEMSDHVIVATRELTPYVPNDNVSVIRNFVQCNIQPATKYSRMTVVVRGTDSRKADYVAYEDWFRKIEAYNSPRWFFIGHMIEGISFKSAEHIEFQQPIGFLHTLLRLSPHFIFHPLRDTVTNRCRSRTAYDEAALCGAQLVTPASWWTMENVIHDVQHMRLPPVPAKPDPHAHLVALSQYEQVFSKTTTLV